MTDNNTTNMNSRNYSGKLPHIMVLWKLLYWTVLMEIKTSH